MTMKNLEGSSEFIRSTWSGELHVNNLKQITEPAYKQYATVGMFLVYGSWNYSVSRQPDTEMMNLLERLLPSYPRSDTKYVTGKIQVDCDDENIEECFDDETFPCPPEQLPCVLLLLHRKSMNAPIYQYLDSLKSPDILNCFQNPTISLTEAKAQFEQLRLSYGMECSVPPIPDDIKHNPNSGIRLFVAGDRMSVGKTTVCLGILGNLVAQGYPCESLAYIKPATQNESPQLVQRYCERMGIACVPIGPIVFYRGFTRAFLAGDTESSSDFLAKVEVAVDNLARGKHVVVVDGVGFPAVGSICGTDNASVARASGYLNPTTQLRIPASALLVGGSGVGGAVDAFNLNATYFDRVQVPVLGALFNKLSLEGFYSLENCKQQITSYFEQSEHQNNLNRKAFGFVPLHSGIGSNDPMKHVDDYIRMFGQNVDVKGILSAALTVKEEPVAMEISASNGQNVFKRQKLDNGAVAARSREEIERGAILGGAAPSA
jgi:dethiobiotin synthetase